MKEPLCTYVIAEAGVNHDGSLEQAFRLVEQAVTCGADAIKFQAFSADRLVTRAAATATYQRRTAAVASQYELLKALELDAEAFQRLQAHCRALGIEFLASPFDEESVDFLADLGVRSFKIPSGEITNTPLLERIAAHGKPVILSTGMCWLAEVDTAIRTLDAAGAGEITLLHCVTEYPAPFEQINLSAMHTLASAFGRPVGYSDHTAGIDMAIAAVAMGARVIEKHFTLDTTLPGPDHAASLALGDFRAMVEAIRHVELARGDGIKRPAPCELDNMRVVRKSIAVGRDIAAGEILSRADLTLKRPGSGMPPSLLETVVGRQAARAIRSDDLLDWRDLA
ncbi:MULTISPECIES: N-acetylneuraminate synthase [unclassified Modicisalibacter]|uniref:N-acetylneuraminate synthase n=1 Tax=unclassified Modicisalibacter TaxID=2679913 RepID=UPI001CCCFFCB|nr:MULTISPECIES: N-acetylneuraminate synthase [unclassified Modicisalibacter]MBZ9560023.1 N-acetylneuraminate synthase [Modicisalibacter sp. R2A 31.J]MBZ9575932.1 N-acetylneuraminate synthase [Modicisalibacter sp. MOD 31.J]